MATIDPKRPVQVISTGRPDPAAMRKLEDYLIDRAIEREAKKVRSESGQEPEATSAAVTTVTAAAQGN